MRITIKWIRAHVNYELISDFMQVDAIVMTEYMKKDIIYVLLYCNIQLWHLFGHKHVLSILK